MEIINRFLTKTETSFFLFGPRGTGKSTWVSFVFPDALVINLLEPDTFRRFAARPETLLELVRALPTPKTVVIDEVQKIPALLDAVHQLMEEKRGHPFVLTGSSARKLKRTGADFLAGRAVLKTLHPFMAAELGPKFSLDSALHMGTLPVILASSNPEEALKSYVALYLKEEVQLEGFVRKIGDFARFLEIASFSHSCRLNISNISRECEVERKTVEGYIGILEDLLIATKVPVFRKRAKRQVSEHPKLYLFDAGVFRTLRPRGTLDRAQDIEGQALEGLVAQHLRAWIAYGTKSYDLCFWRTRSGVEVDFVVYGEDGFWAIEVKNSRRVRPEDLRPLRAFGDEFPESRRFLLYRGNERLSQEGVICLPCEEFLARLRPGQPLPE
ncbi:MAG: ATP-binding protein [Candidatus Aminicenantes bacterium]|nr:ATP-binding protein [Candidatus Aminicenantes bacterium]